MMNTAAAHAVSLTTNLDHQLEQAPELRKLAYEVIVAEGVRDLTTAQRIALTMFYRSLQTHEAVEMLLRQKLVEGRSGSGARLGRARGELRLHAARGR
jgi:hypothetical protein